MKSVQIEDLLKKMSLQDKARQITQINADFIKADVKAEATGVSDGFDLTKADVFGCGSVLNFGDARDAEYIRKKYLEVSENKIPLVMMQDVIHGYRTIFPVPLALACSFDADLVEECCKMSAVEASLNGVDVTFSPMINLSRDARWGRVMEGYGEDPYLNGLFGRAAVRGYRAGGLASCVKHYAAYGAAEAGKDYNTTDLSEHNLREYYLRAFEECLKENPELIMTSFNLLNGVPVNANSHLLVDILRKEWKYNGVVISDYAAVIEMIKHGYAENKKECARVAALNAVDMEMMSSAYIEFLPELVEEGAVPASVVDEMAKRVLELKQKLNLFENPDNATSVQKAEEACLCPEHREIALRSAEKSFVLLENDGVLPLNEGQKVALVGPLAAEKNILGAWACAGRADECVSVKEGVEKLLGAKVLYSKGCSVDLLSDDESMIADAVKTAKKAEVAVACVGEHSYHSGESASRADICLPKVQVKLLKELKKAGKPVVAVIFGGRPQVLTGVKEIADAILYVWQPGTEGGSAIAETLYGKVCPEGKLAMSFPRSVGQCPVYYNHFSSGRPKSKDELHGQAYTCGYIDELNSPLYPFGYGLSYTRFEYGDIKLSSAVMERGGKISVSVPLKNCGSRAGGEVVQLYIRDKFASCARPVRELKAFRKVTLAAGEQKTVVFEITEDDLKFYGANGKFAAEAGEFEVMAGGDSRCAVAGVFRLL